MYICLIIKVNHKNKSQKKQLNKTFKKLYITKSTTAVDPRHLKAKE